MAVALIGQSLPVFFLGILFILIFGVKLGWFPVAGRGGLSHLIMPAVTLGLYGMARTARLDLVEAAMPALGPCECAIEQRTVRYIRAGLAEVTPFYRLEKAGAFNDGDTRGAEFALVRLGAGAGELRDLIVMAWRESANARVGWPAVSVAEVEAGTADAWDAMIGTD